MTTGFSVRKIGRISVSTLRPNSPNEGPRWSIVGWAIARKTRSGTFVGPGICKKWRPLA
jgi:hypothetical protein